MRQNQKHARMAAAYLTKSVKVCKTRPTITSEQAINIIKVSLQCLNQTEVDQTEMDADSHPQDPIASFKDAILHRSCLKPDSAYHNLQLPSVETITSSANIRQAAATACRPLHALPHCFKNTKHVNDHDTFISTPCTYSAALTLLNDRLDDGGGPFPAPEAPPLPESSRADDPFHDDWGHWAQEEGGALNR